MIFGWEMIWYNIPIPFPILFGKNLFLEKTLIKHGSSFVDKKEKGDSLGEVLDKRRKSPFGYVCDRNLTWVVYERVWGHLSCSRLTSHTRKHKPSIYQNNLRQRFWIIVIRGKMSLCFEDYIRKFMVMENKIDDS
jgi:hypothetical protein